jgi:hypothetical protein
MNRPQPLIAHEAASLFVQLSFSMKILKNDELLAKCPLLGRSATRA